MNTTNLNSRILKMKWTGIILILLSTAFFLLAEYAFINVDRDDFFYLFSINFIIAIAYFIALAVMGMSNGKWFGLVRNNEMFILFLFLLMISAFSLNREIPVFEISTDWLSTFLTIETVAIILLMFRNKIPTFYQFILCFILGSGLVLYLYFAIHMVPMYIIGFLGLVLFGITFHVYVPLLLLIATIILARKIVKENSYFKYAIFAGIAAPFIVLIAFMMQWHDYSKRINYIQNKSIINETTLPNWVKISQALPTSWVAERILKTELVYTTPRQGNWFWGMPAMNSFNEVRKHDPLIMIASMIMDKPDISRQNRIKILEAMYDSRHQAQERLWAGDHLETANVISNIKVFPDFRLAYTEKILSVKNNRKQTRWNRPEEAIYTFHLPEGGVVTSLSLWINDKEENGILTSKKKADTAYKTIVGREARDPSLVHWQEGNTVSVRVFPCTPSENRRFKLGITAPLRKEGDQLIYENIYFDGPSGSAATESIQLKVMSDKKPLSLPFDFNNSLGNVYNVDKYYQPYWEMSFSSPELSDMAFTFDSTFYKLNAYDKKYESFDAEIIYLDINNSWTSQEFNRIWHEIKDKDVYVFGELLVKLNDENKDEVFEILSSDNFSLFPLHKINNPKNSLLISKSSFTSPNLSDLKESSFGMHLTEYLQSNGGLRLFNIGHELSPYLKTLKELRVFKYDQGEISQLLSLLDKKEFITTVEDDGLIALDNADMMISKNLGEAGNSAPDHLMRLFTYNHLMQEIGGNYFNDNYIQDQLINEAQKAYVVSPLSSLVVLETQKDYDRFNINDSDKSLKNASMNSSGAVPEPHEWALIFLAAGLMIYLVYGKKFQLNIRK